MADCKTCKEHRAGQTPVPYIVHESAMARMERTVKRLWILLILVVVMLVASNGAWMYYENQFTDEITQTVTQDAENGTNNFVGGDVNG